MGGEASPMATWSRLHRAHAWIMGELSHRMEQEHDVSVLEHGCLHELSKSPGRTLRMRDLAARLGVTPSTATRLCDRLEERGWIERTTPSTNRREVHVAITSVGRRAYVSNNRPFQAAVEELFAGRFSDAQLSELERLLDLLGADASHPSSTRQP